MRTDPPRPTVSWTEGAGTFASSSASLAANLFHVGYALSDRAGRWVRSAHGAPDAAVCLDAAAGSDAGGGLDAAVTPTLWMLPPDRIAKLAGRLAGVRWSWAPAELDRVVADLGWTVAASLVLQTDLDGPDRFATVRPHGDKLGGIEVRIAEPAGVDSQATAFRRDAFTAAHRAVTRVTGLAGELRPGPQPVARWPVPSGLLQLSDIFGTLTLALHSADHSRQLDHDAERDAEMAEYIHEYGDPLAMLDDADEVPFDDVEAEEIVVTVPETWEDFGARLTDLLGRLPSGTDLELREVSRPVGGYTVRIGQRPDRLSAGVADGRRTDPDRRLSARVRDALAGLGWRAPDRDDPEHWRTDLDWPAPAAGYRDLAAGLVTVLRDGLRAPTALAQQVRLNNPTPERELAWSRLGLSWMTIRHLARVGPDDTPDRPREVLRRIQVGSVDRAEAFDQAEAFDRDGGWRPTDAFELSARGELGDQLVPMPESAVERVVDWWRQAARWAAPVPPHPTSGLRLAMPVDSMRDGAGVPVVPGGRLVGDERAAAVGYLRDAPMVLAAWGFDRDPFDPDQPEVVPVHFHTDGSWVWPESLAYHLERYGIPPHPDFLRHLAQRRYRLPEVTEEQLRQAADLLAGR